ncbi:MAG: radical SAM protein [Coriobacteriales bacterium]|nr:radical SAM protein [Coriobacteriales bacterium]
MPSENQRGGTVFEQDGADLIPVSCTLCPRACGANRRAGQRGFCGADGSLRVARAALHHGEEPPISGTRGSGTVFFSNCPLRCVYCQNEPVSTGRIGASISIERLADIFVELAEQGAHNINLVSPTQYAPQIVAALAAAGGRGMSLPVVYNTGGYELPRAVERLAGFVDIYLTDFKYASAALAGRYSQAPDYPRVTLEALRAMVEQVGACVRDDEGLLRSGVIVRHLMLPGQLEDAKAVLGMVYEAVGNRVCYSLMNQYTPLPSAARFAELGATVAADEYDELIDFALDLGITDSYMQEGGAAEESFIPAFDLTGVRE